MLTDNATVPADEGKKHVSVSLLLLGGLLFLRFPFLIGVDLLLPQESAILRTLTTFIFGVGTYLITVVLIWWEREHLRTFWIDLAAAITFLFQTFCFPIGIGLFVAMRRHQARFPAPPANVWRWALLGAILAIICNIFIVSSWIEPPSSRGSQPASFGFLIPALLIQMTWVAVFEEPLFRGFIWGYLRRVRWKDGWIWLFQHLREHPELERQLMDVPLDTLAAADQFFRALVLEERGNFIEAQIIADSADKGLYTPEHINCRNRQVDYVVEWLSTTEGPIVDLASGRGYLVEKVIREFKRPMIATDFSPRVLRRDRKQLESFGLYNDVSLLAFDARCTPFKEGAITTLTTYVGLPNIREPGNLLVELRRIVAGAFLAISQFFPEEDEANAKVIREAKLDPQLYRRTALQHFVEAGWNVEVKNTSVGEAHPTPPSVLLDGAKIDDLPVTKTNLEWCVLLATHALSRSKPGTA